MDNRAWRVCRVTFAFELHPSAPTSYDSFYTSSYERVESEVAGLFYVRPRVEIQNSQFSLIPIILYLQHLNHSPSKPETKNNHHAKPGNIY